MPIKLIRYTYPMPRKKLTNQQMDNQNWRYKKKTPPIDEFAHLNGEVKIVRPPKQQ